MARLPAAARKTKKVTLVGGPWGGQEALLPVQTDDPWSLPITVHSYHGRYNMNNGTWSELISPENDRVKS